MSTSNEISRLQTARNTIRTKFVELGIATSVDKLDALATAASGIENRGAVNASVTEGTSYTIPKGYHNGGGVITGVAGGGNYNLQEKTVTPTKSQQNVTSDEGYYGLSSVTVNAIPDNYQDVSATTVAAADVLTGKVFTAKDGTVTTGTMANNGAVSKTLDTTTTSYTVPAGYHSGTGKVSIATETKSVTPTKSAQDVTPTAGKVLSKVSVAAIPANYIDTTDATAKAAQILDGETAYVNTVKVEGTMPNNGATGGSIDGITTMSLAIPAGYTTGGTVSLTSDIEDALKDI